MGETALDLIDKTIADLEARLGLNPGESLSTGKHLGQGLAGSEGKEQLRKKQRQKGNKSGDGGNREKKQPAVAKIDQPDICKLEFKVGQITKVWVHPDADKLYCEEIDCGEDQPRRIASGLRLHYSESEMLGQRLLVVANLKPKNLVGFKSFGMVLCACHTSDDGKETVQFVEPPQSAPLGETITFEGLPVPKPLSAAQVEKKKIFAQCMGGMRTRDDCVAEWNGHTFLTSAGPCRSKTIKGGVMR